MTERVPLLEVRKLAGLEDLNARGEFHRYDRPGCKPL